MADTGETPTKEHKEQRYLSLDKRGEFDPRIATLPARLYKLFVQMRLLAITEDTPGVLDIAWPVLCECLGIRSLLLQESYAQMLEERRLIGFRKEDEAIVIARWTMPQLEVQSFKREPLPPRRRYPSDLRRGRKRDEAAQDSAQDTPSDVPQRPADAPPSADLQQFFEDKATGETAASETLAESGAEQCGVAAESARSLEIKPNKERKKESQSPPPNPLPAESAAESTEAGRAGQAGGQAQVFVSETQRKEVERLLVGQGVNAGNAHSLAFAQALDVSKVLTQIEALPDRCGTDPPGLLVKAIREDLPLPKAYLDRMQAQASRRQSEAAEAEARSRREARLRESDAQLDSVLAAMQSSQGAESEGNYAAL